MNCERKYIRVRKANPNITKTFLSSSCKSAVKISSVPRLIKSEPSEVQNDNKNQIGTSNGSKNEGQVAFNRVPCELLTSYPGYAGNIDGIRKHFTSTTILNGAAVTEQLHYVDHSNSDAVVAMPLETQLEVPLAAETLSESEQTIDTADFFKSEDEETYIMTSDDLMSGCYLNVENSPITRTKPTEPVVSRSNWLTKKTSKADKITGTSKRGLIRFGRSRMIADTHTCIPVSEFKAQLNDTSDIIGKFDMAPPTKREMHVLNTKGVNKLFANPGRMLSNRCMTQFVRHLTMKQKPVDVTFDDMPLQPVGFTPEVDPSKIKRITRKRRYPEAEEYQRKLYNSQLALTFLNTMDQVTEPQSYYIQEEVILPDSEDNMTQYELVGPNKQRHSREGNVMYPHGLLSDDVGLLEVEVEQVLQEDMLESEPQLQENLLESESELQEHLLEMPIDEDFLECGHQEEVMLGSQEQLNESSLESQDDFMPSSDSLLLKTESEFIEFITPEADDLLDQESSMKPTILMIPEGAEGDEYKYNQLSQQNIEILLAAAERNGISRASIQQVIICQTEDGTDQATFLSNTGQIMFPIDPLSDSITETVMTS